jgi:hypothetical protein
MGRTVADTQSAHRAVGWAIFAGIINPPLVNYPC